MPTPMTPRDHRPVPSKPLAPASGLADRLRRKLLVLRAACLLLVVAWAAVLAFAARGGRLDVTSSRSGTRFGSPSLTRTVSGTDTPWVFLFELIVHFAIGVAMVAMLYFVLARLVGHFHGRRLPFLRRRYPH
ncbi:hypothetical protein [Arenimonas sp.]|uniref:hypothetical protein n=1 Tax=Arenimonas sp. TaxID=1872635 RepID=UPI002E304E54|nr:hypothetical protein [Arenimonas sp.]